MTDEAYAPQDLGSNDYGCRYFTATTSAQADEVPRWMVGRYVVMRATGDAVWYGFSTNPSATITAAPTATAAGAVSGGVLPDSLAVETHRVVPKVKRGTPLYFVRRTASTTASVLIEIADTRNS